MTKPTPMFKFDLIDNRETWDHALASLPSAHILQSWDWGDFKSRWGWEARRLLWFKKDESSKASKTQNKSRPLSYTQTGKCQVFV